MRHNCLYKKDLFINNINTIDCIFQYDYIHLAIRFFLIQKEISMYRLKSEDKDFLHTFLSAKKNRLSADVTMYKLEHIASIIEVPLSTFIYQIEYIAMFDNMMSKEMNFDQLKNFSYFRSLELL